MLIISVLIAAAAHVSADPASDLQKKATAASTALKDLKATMVVTSINKNNAEEINPAFSDIGQFQKATIYYKHPGKYRAEGVAKGMAVAYVVNGHKLQIVIPGMLKRTEDISQKAGKQRTTLDMGFITGSLWSENKVTYVGKEGKNVKLKLTPKGSKSRRHELIWVDPGTLRLVRRQRYNSEGEFRARYVYSSFKNVGKLPIAQQAKVYAPDGGYVGTVEYRGLKVNTGLADSLFNLIK
jgi:outer membrane lipoprotein-sorting protein